MSTLYWHKGQPLVCPYYICIQANHQYVRITLVYRPTTSMSALYWYIGQPLVCPHYIGIQANHQFVRIILVYRPTTSLYALHWYIGQPLVCLHYIDIKFLYVLLLIYDYNIQRQKIIKKTTSSTSCILQNKNYKENKPSFK